MFWWKQQVHTGVWAAFTDRSAGNLGLHVGDDAAAVHRRRRSLEGALPVPAGSLRFMNQVHSAEAAVVSTDGPASTQAAVTADALVSPDGAVPLAVMVADCLPVVLVGTLPDGGAATAVAHAGRRGLLDGVLANAVAGLREAGAGALQAWIGPSICGACYEVPEQMQADAIARIPELASRTAWGTPALDLAAGATAELAGLGVEAHRVHGCTREEGRLYSYRLDERTGRFAGLVWKDA
ncbi:polyphenol oxidase family protein [Arthrobacter sulfonylureivorans]|uniref:Polyphenol oxidase family protein n=1 Tax=Arthrobacter sulfonylureivorans TaxID=2486855 RepID=A0ABY3W5J1_9MICC|nr:polyphenol oxidase family protein [Arthrobacter sulfonylureivorans]UNK44692.1 polyphenol oxidase family protein [Arthrobacter sulfonylureivorans]